MLVSFHIPRSESLYTSDRSLVKLVILHDIKNDEGIRLFFMDVWEHYVKVSLNHPIPHACIVESDHVHMSVPRIDIVEPVPYTDDKDHLSSVRPTSKSQRQETPIVLAAGCLASVLLDFLGTGVGVMHTSRYMV